MTELARCSMIDHWLAVAPFLQELVSADCVVSLVDTEKCLYYRDGKNIKFPIKIGDKLNNNSMVGKSITQNKRLHAEVDAKLFGFPYIAVAIPIRDQGGQAIGAITLCELTDRKQKLLNFAEKLDASIQQSNESIKQVANEADFLSQIGIKLTDMTEGTVKHMQKTDAVLKFIKKVANQTNLLGLNAAIEAARVGSLGLGFAVVANEVRKLSIDSNQSVNQIEEVIKGIQTQISEIQNTTTTISNSSNSQYSAIQHLLSFSEELAKMSHQIKEMAEQLGKDI